MSHDQHVTHQGQQQQSSAALRPISNAEFAIPRMFVLDFLKQPQKWIKIEGSRKTFGITIRLSGGSEFCSTRPIATDNTLYSVRIGYRERGTQDEERLFANVAADYTFVKAKDNVNGFNEHYVAIGLIDIPILTIGELGYWEVVARLFGTSKNPDGKFTGIVQIGELFISEAVQVRQ